MPKSGPNDGNGRVLAATIPVNRTQAPPPRKRYVARRVRPGHHRRWQAGRGCLESAPSTGAFVNTMTGAPAGPATQAKLLWDDKFLYVAFENADTDIWSSLNKRDDKLWTQEADELMIDADGNGAATSSCRWPRTATSSTPTCPSTASTRTASIPSESRTRGTRR